MAAIVESWEIFKDWLSAAVHLSHFQLHVTLGLALTVLIGRLLRKPLGSFLPLLIVLVLELANELSDFLRYHLANWPWTPRETLIDIAITMLPPLALVLAARMATQLRASRRGAA